MSHFLYLLLAKVRLTKLELSTSDIYLCSFNIPTLESDLLKESLPDVAFGSITDG